ncbi:LysR family transcriptional regulator [Halomonas huangheensis]|uniref:HTH lysR-type domain-containing protein n=1 Tax=Halomonas huangheensis TaxID=1178482 RepID=W1N5C7_9GAMM|nr:LysR family transcriptional regulator [Halomonas huangheensis]ALM51833.1 LysR family transcriptional regulator [Halomonas huangheensis]ERL50351.1 hypothetical protein BJB45_04270 [Halomonas huangheensis]
MNITGKDLNLLWVFQVLYEERSVSRAAERMSLSQPALSHRLGKLRNEFDDPLFVRAPRGLTPTPRAHQLALPVSRMLVQLDAFYEEMEGQNFLQRDERLHIYATDYLEQRLLPSLLPQLRRGAPNLTLVTHNTGGTLPREALEKGTCDLAIAGFFSDLPETFRQQRLLSEPFVVLAAKDNARIASSGALDLDTYLACEHLLTTLTGDLNGIVDRALDQLGTQRRVIAGVSSFLAPTRIVPNSDYLLTCLKSVAEQAVYLDASLCIHSLPLTLPSVDLMQIWHERTDGDRLRRWVREQIHAVACQIE